MYRYTGLLCLTNSQFLYKEERRILLGNSILFCSVLHCKNLQVRVQIRQIEFRITKSKGDSLDMQAHADETHILHYTTALFTGVYPSGFIKFTCPEITERVMELFVLHLQKSYSLELVVLSLNIL